MPKNHYDLKLYDNAGTGYVFYACFRSELLAEKFIERYQHMGGVLNFTHDVYGMNDFSGQGLEILPCNSKGFKKVMDYLYPKAKNGK